MRKEWHYAALVSKSIKNYAIRSSDSLESSFLFITFKAHVSPVHFSMPS